MTHSKRLIKYLAAFVFIFLCLLITPKLSIAETIIYGANAYGRTEMIEINLSQGTSQKVGNIAFETQAMDQDPETGYVYYFERSTSGDEFAYWDPVTGTNTIVRVYDVAPGIYAKQMAFAPDGTLYLVDNDDGLYIINKYNGDLSFVGTITGLETGTYNRTGDMAFAPDGTLYVATYGSLYTIDIENMAATLLYADLIDVGGFSVWSGLAFCDGLLYASNLEELTSLSAIFSIDPSTGDVNLLFYTDTYLNDLTSCPANGIPPINQPPELGPIGDRSVTEGEELRFTVTASDSDDDNLTLSTGMLPSGASFYPVSGEFRWTPDNGQAGNYPVLFTVTDDGSPAESDSEHITITVNTSSTPIIVTLTGENDTEDTMIVSGSYSSRNYGGSTADLAVGSYGNILRALTNWNISSIPTGSTILRAEMSLYCRQDYTGGPITINAYRMLQPWVEGLLQDQDRMLDNPYSTSWLEYGYGEQWEGPGAGGANDRDPSILASTTKSGTGWYVWDLTATVQHWVDGDWINNGLILVSNNEGGYNTKIFSPSEYQSEDLRPKLVIEYQNPQTTTNRPPVLDPIGAQTVNEGELLEFVITANDPDPDDTLTYSAGNAPAGSNFDPGNRIFSWAPGFGDAGNYVVTLTVSDDGTPFQSDFEEVTITVADVNRPPVLDPIGAQTVNEGELLEFVITANDPDPGDTLTYSAGNAPAGSNFDPANRIFSWTPGFSDAGNYVVTLTVSDNGTTVQSDFEEVAITVADVNDPPSPDPMTWAAPPSAAGTDSITMTATEASAPSGVEYYFEETSGGGTDSDWQDSVSYTDSNLSADTEYGYRVRARDSSAPQVVTAWSSELSATTDEAPKSGCGAIPMYRDGGQTHVSATTSSGKALLPLLPSMMVLGLWSLYRAGRKRKYQIMSGSKDSQTP